jgi:hypothetical protein
MNKKILLISIIITVVITLGFVFHFLYQSNIEENQQSDELSEESLASDFGNNQIEKAITDYLLTQKQFSWKTKNDGRNFCAIENLKPEEELFPLYVWVYCGEYIIQENELKALSGSSGPAKIDYPNELSFYDLSKFSYEIPGDGSYYAEDIKRIFPKDIHQKIFDFNRENIIKRIEKMALANI